MNTKLFSSLFKSVLIYTTSILFALLFTRTAYAQDPAAYFDPEAEQQFVDSIHRHNSSISREEMRGLMKEYNQRQADAYYQAYRRRIDQIADNEAKQAKKSFRKSHLETEIMTLNSTTSEGQVPDAVEYEALKAIYEAMGGDNWVHNDNWFTDRNGNSCDPCTLEDVKRRWFGVTVGWQGDIVALSLSRNNVTNISINEIAKLTALQSLSLRENQFTGTIPKDIGDLKELKTLDLSFNEFEGLIPKNLGNISKLEKLYLNFNNLEGELPSSFSNLLSIEYMKLNDNRLVGKIPDGFANLSLLGTLNIQNNDFSDIPTLSRNTSAHALNNKFTYEDIIPNLHNGSRWHEQDSVGVKKAITLTVGETLVIDLNIDKGVSSNIYTWRKTDYVNNIGSR